VVMIIDDKLYKGRELFMKIVLDDKVKTYLRVRGRDALTVYMEIIGSC